MRKKSQEPPPGNKKLNKNNSDYQDQRTEESDEAERNVKRIFIGDLNKDQFRMNQKGQRIHFVDIQNSNEPKP